MHSTPEQMRGASGVGGLLQQTERALRHVSASVEKVDVLLEAMERVSELRGGPTFEVQAGGGGAASALAADHALVTHATSALFALARKHGLLKQLEEAVMARHRSKLDGKWGSGRGGAPLEGMSCANIHVARNSACTGRARLVCSRCKLVTYCSPACQKEHYSTHKVDCKSSKAADDFAPLWVQEGRPPAYVRPEAGWVKGRLQPACSAAIGGECSVLATILQLGLCQVSLAATLRCRDSFHHRMALNAVRRQFLWGNTPAFSLIPRLDSVLPSPDVAAPGAAATPGKARLSAPANGGSIQGTTDVPLTQPEAHICFAASGDLRNVIATVNRLPLGYQVGLVRPALPIILGRMSCAGCGTQQMY
jgi:hypothetical protein